MKSFLRLILWGLAALTLLLVIFFAVDSCSSEAASNQFTYDGF